MHYTFEKIPDQPILIHTLSKDFDYATDGSGSLTELMDFLDRQPQPVIYVLNLLEVSFGFDDLVVAASTATRQMQLFKHANLRETVLVTQDRIMELAAKGVNSPIFGNVKIRVFKTQDRALEYARAASKN